MSDTPGKLPADADPDLKPGAIKDAARTAELGNTLTIQSKFLTTSPLTIEYSQSFRKRTNDYYQVIFTNTSIDNTKFYLFIAETKLDEFKRLAKDKDGILSFDITKNFQYGQKDKSGKNRFLVYHENELKIIYQHRFIMASFLEYGTMAINFLDNVPQTPEEAKMLPRLLEGLSGDQLKIFG